MKLRIVFPCLVASLAIPLSVPAQVASSAYGSGGQTSQPAESSRYTLNHAEFGVYADYFRLAPANSTANYVGTGGRVAFSVQPNLAIEGEMNYDFARNYTTTSTINNGTTTTTTFVTSSVRPMTGLFGPKLQFGTSGPIRVFATGKLGFVDVSISNPNNVTGTQFSNSVNGIGGSGTHLAFYPGGGFEGFFGTVGLRLEAGDEIYLNNGPYNNLRVTVGPTIRF
ncbi:MAG: hypothetical protein WBE74_19315 [Terracidiphilus sp.]